MRKLALGLALVFGVLPASAAEGKAVFSDPSRIAAIGGSITEIVYALGEQGRLIARDSTSRWNTASVNGQTLVPDVKVGVRLHP